MAPASYDAVVVGGGVIGLAVAWRAAQRGLAICVLERAEPGAGASSVAAGMLAPVGEAHFGEHELVALNLDSHRRWPEFAAAVEEASGTSVGLRRDGALRVALDRDEAEELRRLHAYQLEVGLQTEWLLPSACRELEPGLSPACAGGIWAPHEASVDAPALIAALRVAAERAGAEVRIGAEAVAATIEAGALVGVETGDGERLGAGQVVLAAGAWSGQAEWLPSEALAPVRPVKGELLLLGGPESESVCSRILSTPRVYLVPRSAGRLVVGATVLERGFDTEVSAGGVHELLREAYRALPEVAELGFVGARAGLRPGTPDNAPLIGPGALSGLLLATGHHRNGILLAPATADALAALLGGEELTGPVARFGAERFASLR